MKLTINIDCTPKEAREFMGLPDVAPINEMIVDNLQERVEENIETLTDPQKYFEKVMAVSGAGREMMQKAFNSMMSGMAKKDG